MTVRAELRQASLAGRLERLDLRLEEGRCLVLVGPNGAGKSTALRLLAGLASPDQGEAQILGRPIRQLSPLERSKYLAWLPQRPRLDPDLGCEEVVAQARFRFSESRRRSLTAARTALAEVGIEHLGARAVGKISGGELQRVLLATLVTQEAPLLLVDEPANHLDPAHQVEAYQLLGGLLTKGRGLCLVTHDIRLCQLLGPAEEIEIVGLSGGRKCLHTSFADEDLPQALEELFGVPFVPRGSPGALSLVLPEESRS